MVPRTRPLVAARDGREQDSGGPGTISLMKKLLILAIIVALGVVAAKRLRPS
jgi:hypothetical protein